MNKSHFMSVALIALFTTACATAPEDPDDLAEYKETNDPLEPMNRKVFAVNKALDKALFKPLAEAYVYVTPETAQDGIHNMIGNVNAPVDLANNLLQGDFSEAGITLSRFLINSTVGIGGMFDVAKYFGMEGRSEDFGQTLATWGYPTGPYVMIPVLGPSSPRAIAGSIVDSALDPLGYTFDNQDAGLEYMFIREGVEGIDERSRVIDILDSIEEDSLDFYATTRSLYRQRREADIENK